MIYNQTECNNKGIRNIGYKLSIEKDKNTMNQKIKRISDLETKYINEVLNTGFRSSSGALMIRLEML